MAFKVIQSDVLDSPTPVNYVPETPSLAELLKHHSRTFGQNLRVAFPSAITQVREDQTVDIQPLFQKRYAGQTVAQNLPVVQNVRVMMPQGKQYRISYPLRIGDTGLTVILDRNMDSWMANTGDPATPVDPSDTRAHNISDAVFVPGLVNDAQQTTDTGLDLVLGNQETVVRIGPDGTYAVKNETAELIAAINDLASAVAGLAADLVPVTSAATVSKVGAAGTSAKAKLASVQKALASFKG